MIDKEQFFDPIPQIFAPKSKFHKSPFNLLMIQIHFTIVLEIVLFDDTVSDGFDRRESVVNFLDDLIITKKDRI